MDTTSNEYSWHTIFTLYSVNTPLIATPWSWRIGKALLCGTKDGSLSPRIANNLLPYLWILDNLFGEKKSQPGGGGGALNPHFGRYVPRQRKKWGAPERARAWNCRAPERAREWNCRAPERERENGGVSGTNFVGCVWLVLTLGCCLNTLRSGWLH